MFGMCHSSKTPARYLIHRRYRTAQIRADKVLKVEHMQGTHL